MRNACLSLLVGLLCVGCVESPLDHVSADDSYPSFSDHQECPQLINDLCCGTAFTCVCERVEWSVALMDTIYGRIPHTDPNEVWGEELWADPQFAIDGEICLDGAEGIDEAIGAEQVYWLEQGGLCAHDNGGHLQDAEGEESTFFLTRGGVSPNTSVLERVKTFRHEGWSGRHCSGRTGQAWEECHPEDHSQKMELSEATDALCYDNHPWEV